MGRSKLDNFGHQKNIWAYNCSKNEAYRIPSPTLPDSARPDRRPSPLAAAPSVQNHRIRAAAAAGSRMVTTATQCGD